MTRLVKVTVMALALLALGAGVADAVSGGTPAIPLNPEQETREVDSDGSGKFSYTIQDDELCYTLTVRDLTAAPFASHIHAGARNVAGGVVVTLQAPPAATGTSSDCISAGEGDLTAAELEAIAANPRNYYVNVHTPNYPAGELRGQLK